MPKQAGQKVKLINILEILQEETDEQHPITTGKLIDKLEARGIKSERKSIYADIESLIEHGVDVLKVESRLGGGYYLGSRDFEVAEVKLLVDAVSSSRFITVKKSRELIKKLEKLTSKHQAVELQRRIFVAGRVKTENESIYYGIDYLNQALIENSQIKFHYSEWNEKKELVFRKQGEFYEVSPWALLWSDENYYLMAFDHNSQAMRHYRVDKISDVELTGKKREGREQYEAMDMADFVNKTFGMFGGVEENVTLMLKKKLIGVVLDRFGKDIFMISEGNDYVKARVKVAVSGQFFGWIFGLGADVVITSPKNVREQYIQYMKDTLNAYIGDDNINEV